ncbi:MAG TPA: M55 family metallopeptidase [Gaiellales bacterium]
MRVFISSDIEGTAGIVHWEQVLDGAEYEGGRTLLENEVNAAIDGAADAGASEFLVNDAHYLMQNLRPERLHGRASLLSGKHKPLYMMEGLDGTFDAAFLVSYHGSISAQHAVLSHTYNPSVVYHAELNGHVVGESGINALVAKHFDVPIALITGDDATAEEMLRIAPGCECVVVKRSITRFAAESLHPDVACERIRAGAARALGRLGQLSAPAIDLPATIEVQLTTSDYAELGTWLPNVERTGPRSLRLTDAEPLRLYRTWVALMAITRAIREQG